MRGELRVQLSETSARRIDERVKYSHGESDSTIDVPTAFCVMIATTRGDPWGRASRGEGNRQAFEHVHQQWRDFVGVCKEHLAQVLYVSVDCSASARR